MKLRKILKDIDGIFIPPKKQYYFGKLRYGSPYFYPWNFESKVVRIRKLKLKSQEERDKFKERYPYLKEIENNIYSNLPMVRRNKEFFIKLFGNHYYVSIGWPVAITKCGLGWKDKWESPRFEWSPAFYIYFFNWQFCMWWNSPDGDNDRYYEQILWFISYSGKDMKKAEETWPWQDYKTKESSWNKSYLINK